MKHIISYCCLAGAVALLSGCATGPKYGQVRNSIPALNPEQGRVFVYRTKALGAAVQPSVVLNGEKVGSATPKGFFYIDRAPGNYEISATTEVKRSLSFTLDKAETRYVRLNMSWGFFVGHCYPELVSPDEGEKELAKCHYTGPQPGAK